MNKLRLAGSLTGLGLLLTTPSFAGMAWTPAAGNRYVQDQVLVKLKPGVTTAARAQMAQSLGAQALHAVGSQPDLVLARLTPGQTVEQAVSVYANDPNVAYAQPNFIYHALAVPTDPQYSQQWAAKNTGQTVASGTYIPKTGTASNDMNLEPAWDVKTDCSTVVVAVVDSGVNYNSEDLAANMWAGNAMHGNNFAGDGAAGDPMDLDGHGTHVAGIIGAVANNGKGGAGVCWTASLMAVRALDVTGAGTTATIIQAVTYAVINGAKVINMSLGGGGGFDQAFSDAITYAQNNDVLVVAAAGNEASNNETTASWPCNFTHPNVICVAALDQNYALANFSNWGATSVDVGAPGTNIYSTWAGTNAVLTGLEIGVAPTGWIGGSTTTATGGGWGYAPAPNIGWLTDPKTGWGAAQYNANTDDRVYKTFNLAGVNAAVLEMDMAINVRSGDTLKLNYHGLGGDPFAAGGTTLGTATAMHDGGTPQFYSGLDLTPCISSTCSVGFQLVSDATLQDIGVAITNFRITTLTSNANSYNTIDGTSMATPEVAGVAALVRAQNPQYTYADVASALKNGGRSTPSLSGKTTTGKAVDAMGSLSYINPPTGISVTVQ